MEWVAARAVPAGWRGARGVARRAVEAGWALTPGAQERQLRAMQLPDDEQVFLRDLVKASRQKIHTVKWVDRDGTDRQTVLTGPEAVRLNTIASRMKISTKELLRQAAHIPVPKPVKPAVADAAGAGEVPPPAAS